MKYGAFSRPATAALALLTSALCLAAGPERQVFQVTFGTRPYLDRKSGSTDGGKYLAEAANGDIVVAGYGASSFTDTGDWVKPMIVRVDRAGRVVWKQIYDDMPDQRILAILDHLGHVFVLLDRASPQANGDTHYHRRVAVRELDDDGVLSRELGGRDNLYVADVLSYHDKDQAGFLVAAIDTCCGTSTGLFLRDVSLFDVKLNGDLNRAPFRDGIKGTQFLQRDDVGRTYFLRMRNYFSQPWGIVRLTPTGEPRLLYAVDNDIQPAQLVVTADRMFFVSTEVGKESPTSIRALSEDGVVLWKKDLPELSRFSQAVVDGDGLLVAGTYEDNPAIVRLSASGETVWTRRFQSAKRKTSISAMKILNDGWLAVTGSTSPGDGAFVSTDSDAFLAVADGEGKGLERYGSCLADASAVESLRAELADRAGLDVQRETLWTGYKPTALEKLPPLDVPLPHALDCRAPTERDLLGFLRDAARETRKLKFSRPSQRVKIYVLVRAAEALPPPGYREGMRRQMGSEPSVEVNADNARAALRYVATEVLPYSERMLTVSDQLRTRLAMWVGDGLSGVFPPENTVSFRDSTIVAERFLELFDTLSPADQEMIRTKFGSRPLEISGDPDLLHVWGGRRILVGRNRVDEIFDFLLVDYPELQRQIDRANERIRDEVGFAINKSDPGLSYPDFLDILRRVGASADELSEGDKATIASVRPAVSVGSNRRSDIFVSDYDRRITIAPAAADRLLRFILANAEAIGARPDRP